MSISMNSESIWMSASSSTSSMQTCTRSEDSSSSTQDIAFEAFAKRQEIVEEVSGLDRLQVVDLEANRAASPSIGSCAKVAYAISALCFISCATLSVLSFVSLFREEGYFNPNVLGALIGAPLCFIGAGVLMYALDKHEQ